MIVFSAFISAFLTCNIWTCQGLVCKWDCLWCDTSILHNRSNPACAQYKTRPIIPKQPYFCLLHLFSHFLLDVRTLVGGSTIKRTVTELESILIIMLHFIKFIDEYAHHAWNPWKSELKERSSRHYRAKYFLTQPLKMCSIILLKCKKL